MKLAKISRLSPAQTMRRFGLPQHVAERLAGRFSDGGQLPYPMLLGLFGADRGIGARGRRAASGSLSAAELFSNGAIGQRARVWTGSRMQMPDGMPARMLDDIARMEASQFGTKPGWDAKGAVASWRRRLIGAHEAGHAMDIGSGRRPISATPQFWNAALRDLRRGQKSPDPFVAGASKGALQVFTRGMSPADIAQARARSEAKGQPFKVVHPRHSALRAKWRSEVGAEAARVGFAPKTAKVVSADQPGTPRSMAHMSAEMKRQLARRGWAASVSGSGGEKKPSGWAAWRARQGDMGKGAAMNKMQKSFWGAALRGAMGAGRGLRAAYMAGADRVGDAAGRAGARGAWTAMGYRKPVGAGAGWEAPRRMPSAADHARVERAAAGGERWGRRAYHAGMAGAGALGAYGLGRAAFGGRRRVADNDYDDGPNGVSDSLATREAMGIPRHLRRAAPEGDLAKAIAALPLAKRAAIADAIEAGDAQALSRIFG